MLWRIASGLKNFIDKKSYDTWFTKLYPLVESRGSSNPDLAEETSMIVGKSAEK